ncbi:MAG TPA: hypothetical protein PKA00_17610 [Saprospiraceae bacterium]|nr:hypothetical protein [Saprospiraceae bacterium]HMQ84739.1 hypothetical protein [Saprospiraceae bacterium]
MSLIAKILAFYFLLGSLFPKTDFGQLAHVPQMLQHYQEHRMFALQTGTSCSLLQFLQQHFMDPASHEHSSDAHNQLPFKHFHGSINYVIASALIIPPPSLGQLSCDLPIAKEAILTGFIDNLFRPPLG